MRTLGIVGGGQLGRLLSHAAKRLGIRTIVLDPTPECPASEVADKQRVGNFTEREAILDLAQGSDVLTFEIESANAEALKELEAQGYPVHPTAHTLALIKDKLAQKTLLTEHHIPVAPFMEVTDAQSVRAAAETLGYPLVLKARSGGYDGRGNALVKNEAGIGKALETLAGNALYAEGFVSFEKELAVVAVRTPKGDIRTYPVVETVHEDHICSQVYMPAPVSDEVKNKAEGLAHKVLELFAGAGVFGIEMFLVGEEVLINEIAPRVHNSGHVTIEACETSQFENHVRAVMGLPLGSTALKVPAAVMLNILGTRTGPAKPKGVTDTEHVTFHIYGKKETKQKRKMGHLTVIGKTLEEARERAHEALSRVSI